LLFVRVRFSVRAVMLKLVLKDRKVDTIVLKYEGLYGGFWLRCRFALIVASTSRILESSIAYGSYPSFLISL